MKKGIIICVIAILILSTMLLVGCKDTIAYNQEIMINSNLENKSANWTYFTDEDAKVTYTEKVLTAGTTDYENESAAHGRTYIGIDSKTAGSYGYFSQEVALDKNAVYVLSVDVKITSKIKKEGSLGAFVGLAESSQISQSITELSVGWQTIQVCFKNNSYDKVNVRFGLGTDASNVTQGYAYFDNISLKKIKDPATEATGLVVFDLGRKGASGFSSTYLTTTRGIIFTTLIVVLGSALTYFGYVAYRRLKSKDNIDSLQTPNDDKGGKAKKFLTSSAFLVTAAALAAFLIRLVLSLTIYGHGDQLNNLMLQANGFAKEGIVSYYFNSTIYYTPGVSYILWIMGLLAKAFGLLTGTQGMAIFLKIPAIVADIIIVFIIFVIANKKLSPLKSFVIALAYALFPALFMLSTLYGSYLSIGILFLMLALINARDKKIIKLTVYYTLSVLFMAESLWVLPLLIAYAVVIYIKNPETRTVLPVSATVSVVASYIITLPLSFNFFAAGRPFIVLERYCTIFSTNKLFTDGAFNLYAMCGQSGLNVNTAGIVMSAILVALGMLYCIGIYIKSRDRQQLILLVGYTMLAVFTFAVRMTPMVSVIALSILFLFAILTGERRILTTTAALSIISTLSLCYELMICKYIAGGANAQEIAMTAGDPVAIIFSIVWVGLTVYMGYLVWDICINKNDKKVNSIDCNYFNYLSSWFKVPSKKETKETEE